MPSKPKGDIKRFNRWAATYDKSILQRWYFYPIHRAMLDLLEQEKRMGTPQTVLDIGCGTGRLLRAVAARWPEARLIGVDPAKRMISEAKRLNPNATFNDASAEALPVPDQSIDLVLSSLSFHHWADQSKGLQEITRVLHPGGWFCLADHTMRLARLFNERVRSGKTLRVLIGNTGLAVRAHRRLWMRFVLITVAQK
jgi:ubiquinone/menaquinone biosynthesis C-methylase UbiE